MFRFLALAALAGSLYAVDGVILIDQARALAGNVTPGDAPGFPVTISQPGSYRLSSNLTVPSGQNGIQVAAQLVSIDLNGFSITTQPQTSLVGGIVTDGVVAPLGISIRNGSIMGFTLPISLNLLGARLLLCRYCTLENLFLFTGSTLNVGLDMGKFSNIRNLTAPTSAISVICPSRVAGVVGLSAKTNIDPFSSDTNSGVCIFDQNALQTP